MMVINVTSWASTWIYYIQKLLVHTIPEPSGKSGLELIFSFDNPKRIFEVDMESITPKS